MGSVTCYAIYTLYSIKVYRLQTPSSVMCNLYFELVIIQVLIIKKDHLFEMKIFTNSTNNNKGKVYHFYFN